MLKKLTLLTVILLSFTITTNAQLPISIDIYAGLAGSAFEDQESGATGVVVGGAVLVDIIPIIDAGAEFNTLVSPFTLEEFGGEVDISLTYFGLFGTFDVLPLPAVKGYLRAGVGMYSGKIKAIAPLEGELDLKSTVGFNLGAGVKTMFGLWGEFRYNIVSMEPDVDGAESAGANSWMLIAGYRFSL